MMSALDHVSAALAQDAPREVKIHWLTPRVGLIFGRVEGGWVLGMALRDGDATFLVAWSSTGQRMVVARLGEVLTFHDGPNGSGLALFGVPLPG